MLQNAKVIAFTVSELLMENLQGAGARVPRVGLISSNMYDLIKHK